jgi:hypothetical protein
MEEDLASLPHDLQHLRHMQELHMQLLKQGLHRDLHTSSKLVACYTRSSAESPCNIPDFPGMKMISKMWISKFRFGIECIIEI